MTSNPFHRPSWIPLQTCFGLHLLAAGWYVWTGPGGFTFLSRPFIEHQVLAPAMVAVSAIALAGAWRPRPAMIASGVITGFWIALLLVLAATGTTPIAGGLWPILLCFLAGIPLTLSGIRKAGRGTGPFISGGVSGAVAGAVFLACTWAPPATTTPRNVAAPHPAGTVPRPGFLTDGKLRVSVGDRALLVEARDGQRHLAVYPAMEFSSASDGAWTIFQFRQAGLPPWTASRAEDGTTWFRAEGEELEAWGWVNVLDGRVHIRCSTRVRREIPAHLATAVRVMIPGKVTVEGEEWPDDEAASAFLAVRDGRLELLRSSREEKGPYAVLASWEPHDPVLWTDAWSVHVRGWLEQGSLEESPTAGWGVPQATIERYGSEFYWGLASTSAGRGWHAVRTRDGTYVFDIEIAAR